MASFHGLRQTEDRPAVAGRVARSFTLLRATLALAGMAAAFVFASQLAGSGGTTAAPELPSFLAQALGAPQADAPLAGRPARGISVAIRDDGYRVAAKDGSVSLSSTEAGDGEWLRLAQGASG